MWVFQKYPHKWLWILLKVEMKGKMWEINTFWFEYECINACFLKKLELPKGTNIMGWREYVFFFLVSYIFSLSLPTPPPPNVHLILLLSFSLPVYFFDEHFVFLYFLLYLPLMRSHACVSFILVQIGSRSQILVSW